MDNIKIGDKVLVKAEIVGIKENFPCGKYEVSVASFDYAMLSKQRIYVNDVLTKSYEDGLNDSWELAKKIINSADRGGFSGAQLEEIFGFHNIYDVFTNYTAAEAAAKIAEWEAQKEIHVNDEVYFEGNTGVVFDIRYGKMCEILGRNAELYVREKEDLTKTGRTIDIAGLLAQIGGAEP